LSDQSFYRSILALLKGASQYINGLMDQSRTAKEPLLARRNNAV
jgi:hypothetical protein